MPYFLKDIQREGLDNDDNEIGKGIVVTFKAKAPLAISSENTWNDKSILLGTHSLNRVQFFLSKNVCPYPVFIQQKISMNPSSGAFIIKICTNPVISNPFNYNNKIHRVCQVKASKASSNHQVHILD